MIAKKIVLIPVLFFVLTTYGQIYKRSQIDSLEKVVNTRQSEERIKTLLQLAEGYTGFHMDSGRTYLKQARTEARKLNYEWGLCKSYFVESRLDDIQLRKSLPQIAEVQLACANWFESHGYHEDALRSELGANSIKVHTDGRKIVFDRLIEMLPEVRKMNNAELLATTWGAISMSKDPVVNHDLALQSADSTLYYVQKTKDSLQIVTFQYAAMFNAMGGSLPLNERLELKKLAERWGNRVLEMRFYNYCAFYHSIRRDIDSTEYYVDKMKELGRDVSSGRIVLRADRHLSRVYYLSHENEVSKELYTRMAQEHKKRGDNYQLMDDFKTLATINLEDEEYDLALEHLLECLKYAEILEDHYQANSVKRNMAELYVITKEYEKAEELFQEVIEWTNTIELNRAIRIMRANAHIEYAEFIRKQKRYDEALEKYVLACNDLENMPWRQITPKTNLLSMYLDLGDTVQADSLYNEMQIDLGEGRLVKEDDYFLEKARVMKQRKKPQKAVEMLTLFIEKKGSEEIIEVNKDAYYHLFEAFEMLGEHEKALRAFKTFKEIEDSLRAGKVVENLAKIQADYEMSLKEAEINDLHQQQELSDLRLLQQESDLQLRQAFIIILSVLALLIIAVSYLLYRRLRHKKEKKEIEMKAKSAELELQNLQTSQKAELAEVKNTIFANISHEFRTPLTLIQVPVKNYMANVSDEEKPVFHDILKNTGQLLKMVDELLELSKMESGSVELQKSNFDMANFSAQLRANFLPLFNDRQVRFSWKDEMPPCQFNGDENRFKIVVNNLLKNALDHVSEKGAVTCSICPLDGGSEGVQVKVTNTGENISDENLPHIFERYYRGDEERYVGNGIGLSLSKQIVELHKGTITVDNSSPGEVTFLVELPGKLERVQETEHSFTTHEKITTDRTGLGTVDANQANRPSLLVVEDNKEMRELLHEVLKNEFDLSYAHNGEEGEAMANEKQPDLILSDVMMPKKDGFELLKAVKENFGTSHIPVVLLTARADGESRVAGLEHNADDYIGKPFEPKELLARVHNLLRQRRHLHKLFSENPFLYTKDLQCTPLDIEFLNKAKHILEERFSDGGFWVNEFCEELALNRNSVHYKIKALTNQSTTEFIKNFRLEKAVHMLIETNKTVADINMLAGFNSPQAFNKAFKKRYNCTPTVFRNQKKTEA